MAMVLPALARALSTDVPDAPDATDATELRVTLDLSDGSRVLGQPLATSLVVRTSYATLAVPLALVQRIEFAAGGETASFFLASGDRISGVHDATALVLTCVWGKTTVGMQHIRRLHVSKRRRASPEGLVLWNTLNSRSDVERSAVGPDGTYRSGEFVPGRFGSALAAGFDQHGVAAFPRDVVNPEAGCIEFWARLVGFPGDLAWGQNPTLVHIVEGDRMPFLLHLNGNDGGGLGGLCAGMNHLGGAATGGYGSWTYERALGCPEAADWHHYAVTWAWKGIPDVDNGTRTLAVFLDGKLNTASWKPGTGEKPPPFTYGELRLMFNQHLRQGRVLFDNLKVWNFPKTRFDDRFQE
jgi:hypothetical protein